VSRIDLLGLELRLGQKLKRRGEDLGAFRLETVT
jgi:hypothetical protein